MNKPDSIIFDMDGTLWDPTALYVQAWNDGLKESNVDKVLSAEDLKPLMGAEGKKVMATLLPGRSEEEQAQVYDTINRHRRQLIEQGGGTLFEGLQDGMEQLAKKYKLFILSNCPAGVITLFMERAGISQYITDEFAYGVNHMPKHHNMQLLIDKHQLINPIYVGDTEGDREQSAIAGLPFVFLSCGFGTVNEYALRFDSFRAFSEYFMAL